MTGLKSGGRCCYKLTVDRKVRSGLICMKTGEPTPIKPVFQRPSFKVQYKSSITAITTFFVNLKSSCYLHTYEVGYNNFSYCTSSLPPQRHFFVGAYRIFCSFKTTFASFLYSLWSVCLTMWSHHTNLTLQQRHEGLRHQQ